MKFRNIFNKIKNHHIFIHKVIKINLFKPNLVQIVQISIEQLIACGARPKNSSFYEQHG